MVKGFAKNFSEPGKLITTIILLIIAVQILVSTLPTIITSIVNLSVGENISGVVQRLPLADFFAANGVVLLGLSAALVLGILAVFGLVKGGKR